MAFVNEYIKIEDIDKYGLFELKCKYSLQTKSHYTKEYLTEDIWTIDREREIWFMYTTNISDPEMDYRMPLGYVVYTFYFHGKYYEVILTSVVEESSKKFSEDPFIETLKLVSIRPTPEEECSNNQLIEIVENALESKSAKNFSNSKLIEVLKESLNIFGLDGRKGPHGVGGTSIEVNNIIVKLKV